MDVEEGEVVEGQGVGEPVVPGVVGMKRGDNGLLAGDNGAFPGTLVCPYGSEEQWAALLDASTAEGKRIREFMDQMRPEGQGRGVSRRLWLATPEAAFVCGGCFTSFKKLSVHEICPAAVARGDQPPEPKSSDLHEAPTPSDGLRVMAELARAAMQAKAGGGGEPEAKEVEGHGAGEGAGGHKAVPKPQPSAPGARGRAQPPVLAPAVLRATVESFRTCMGDLFAFEQCAGLGEDDATRMANMRTAMARMDRGAFAVLASLPAGQKVLELIQDPASEEWLTTVGSAQFMQVRLGLDRIVFSLERALTTMTASAASAAAPQSGASGGPGALKLVTLGVDLTAYHVGAVVSQDGIQYVRLQGTTAGVQLLKRKEGDVSDHGPLLALRLGVPRVVGENRGVLQHMRQASRGVTSGAGVVPGEVWRGQVGNAVQRGQVPVLAGAIPGVITGAGQRWLAAFNAYRTMVTRAHCEADPLRVQLATLIGGRSMDLAIQKHGVVMVDGVWDSVVDEYNNDMDVWLVSEDMEGSSSGEPGEAFSGPSSPAPDFAVMFTTALKSAVDTAAAVSRLQLTMPHVGRATVSGGAGAGKGAESGASAGAGSAGAMLGGGALMGGASGSKPPVVIKKRKANDVDLQAREGRGPCRFQEACVKEDCAFAHARSEPNRGARLPWK